jgi:hypothetical protein
MHFSWLKDQVDRWWIPSVRGGHARSVLLSLEMLSGCANHLNPKSELRNKCKIPMVKFSKPARLVVSNLELFSLGFVSDFDIRIWLPLRRAAFQ